MVLVIWVVLIVRNMMLVGWDIFVGLVCIGFGMGRCFFVVMSLSFGCGVWLYSVGVCFVLWRVVVIVVLIVFGLIIVIFVV